MGPYGCGRDGLRAEVAENGAGDAAGLDAALWRPRRSNALEGELTLPEGDRGRPARSRAAAAVGTASKLLLAVDAGALTAEPGVQDTQFHRVPPPARGTSWRCTKQQASRISPVLHGHAPRSPQATPTGPVAAAGATCYGAAGVGAGRQGRPVVTVVGVAHL